jgi:PAS domain-containing protein
VDKKTEIRTTLRLPIATHKRLQTRARIEGLALEALIESAIDRELKRLELLNTLPDPGDWGPELAHRLLLTAPTPIVIKDVSEDDSRSGMEQKIAWANLAYEDVFGLSSSAELIGRTVRELTILDMEAADLITLDVQQVKLNEPKEFIEGITIAPRGTTGGPRRVLFRSHRVAFNHRTHRFVGDISFDWSQILPGEHPAPDLRERLLASPLVGDMGELFETFIDNSPTSIAVKRPNGVIVYANQVYRSLVPGGKDPIGKTVMDLWDLPVHHPVYVNDARVAKLNIWLYAKEQLGGRVRTSLRFPVQNSEGNVAFTGVFGANFRLTEEKANVIDPEPAA